MVFLHGEKPVFHRSAAAIVASCPLLLGSDCQGIERIEVVECASDAECADGVYCNGVERCRPDDPVSTSFGCVAGDPCPELPFRLESCFEGNRQCVSAGPPCTSNAECDDGRFCNGAEQCAPSDPLADFDGCLPEEPPCSGDQFCDDVADTCSAEGCDQPDRDGDGRARADCGGDDCDDDDASRFPGNAEVCDGDGEDDDCNPQTFGARDADGDGYVSADCTNTNDAGDVFAGRDCDDTRSVVHPNVPEVCNGVDDNCDGDVDEGLLVDLYPDLDGDGYGDAESTPESACPGARDRSRLNSDCDDANPQIQPGAIRCVQGGQGIEFDLCTPQGTWERAICAQGLRCVAQPGGHGVCVP